jgi:hypothetical protein
VHERYRGASVEKRRQPLAAFSAACFQQAAAATARWTEAVFSTPIQHPPPVLFARSWNQFNRQASFVEGPDHLEHELSRQVTTQRRRRFGVLSGLVDRLL